MAETGIASAIERGITGQSDLITSLSVAVIGGLLALLLQIRMHNAAHPGQTVTIQWFPLLCVALGLCALAIVAGFLVSGMLVELAPQIFSHQFEADKRFSDQDFGLAPVGQLRLIAVAQFVLFCGAVLAGVAFFLKNRH